MAERYDGVLEARRVSEAEERAGQDEVQVD